MHDALPRDLAALILGQAVDAVIYADREGVIRLWNAAAEQVFGFSSEEAIGSSLDLIIPERLRDGHWKGYRAAVSSGTTRLGGLLSADSVPDARLAFEWDQLDRTIRFAPEPDNLTWRSAPELIGVLFNLKATSGSSSGADIALKLTELICTKGNLLREVVL